MAKEYYVYILLTENDTFYCGYTDDINKRFDAHKSGKGAKYTRANKPIKIIYQKALKTKSEAMKEDYRIKQLTKEEKNKAPMVIAKSSSYNFGEINAGEEVTATFELTNRGYSTLKIYRIYDDRNALEIVAPESVKASSNFTIKAKVKNTNKKENPVYK